MCPKPFQRSCLGLCTFATGTLASLSVLCNTTVQEAEASCLNPLLHNMTTHTEISNEHLSSWYFAVRYSSIVFEQRIDELERVGLNCTYDRYNLQKLQDMEQFLKMSWDAWMDSMETTSNHQEAVK